MTYDNDQQSSRPTDEMVRRLALPLMPSATKLQLVRDAARNQDMAWLRALAADGAFNLPARLPKDGQHQGSPRFHNKEFPAIAALAEFIGATKLIDLRVDPDTGARLSGSEAIHQATVKVSADFLKFFQERVVDFLRQVKELEAARRRIVYQDRSRYSVGETNRASADSIWYDVRGEATAGVLLGAACAIADTASIRSILKAFPDATDVNLAPEMLASTGLSGKSLVRPAVVALMYGHTDAIEALVNGGWKATDVVSFRIPGDDPRWGKPGPHELKDDDQPVLLPQWLAWECKDIGIFMPPSAFDYCLDLMPIEAERGNEAFMRGLVGMAEAAVTEPMCGPLLPLFNQHGLLDIDPNSLAILACQQTRVEAMALLRGRVDWTEWAEQVTPTGRARDAGDFPPVALAQATDAKNSLDLSEIEAEVLAWCNSCIEAGHGHLLAADGGDGPARTFAASDLPGPLLACLEQGLDPHDKSHGGLSAAELAESFDRCERVVLSHLAKREALAAVAEMGASGAPSARAERISP